MTGFLNVINTRSSKSSHHKASLAVFCKKCYFKTFRKNPWKTTLMGFCFFSFFFFFFCNFTKIVFCVQFIDSILGNNAIRWLVIRIKQCSTPLVYLNFQSFNLSLDNYIAFFFEQTLIYISSAKLFFMRVNFHQNNHNSLLFCATGKRSV